LFSSHLLCFERFLFSAPARGNHLVNTGDQQSVTEHDPEKCGAVLREDHAQSRR
jgi:hypothetical protein